MKPASPRIMKEYGVTFVFNHLDAYFQSRLAIDFSNESEPRYLRWPGSLTKGIRGGFYYLIPGENITCGFPTERD
jgi:hypothetical protein